VNVTINSCASSVVNSGTAIQMTTADASARKIMVAPNPFTNSVRVMIDSEKKQKASLILTDLMGRQLKVTTLQLVPGTNHAFIGGLDQYPAGSYFLRLATSEGSQTFKLLRQQ
jgi:hypothetical protein